MKRVLRKLVWIIDGLSYVSGGLAALCLIASAIIITEGVISRKVFGVSAVWQIEASVFLLIYACFFGASYAQMHEHHLNVDLVIAHLSPKWKRITIISASIASCLICGLIAWYSWPMWWEALTHHEHSDSLWGPPLWIPYLSLPLGMTILFLQYIVYIARKIASQKESEHEKPLVSHC